MSLLALDFETSQSQRKGRRTTSKVWRNYCSANFMDASYGIQTKLPATTVRKINTIAKNRTTGSAHSLNHLNHRNKFCKDPYPTTS